MTVLTLAYLRDDFSESDLPYKVDVVDWHELTDSFKHLIDKDKIRLF